MNKNTIRNNTTACEVSRQPLIGCCLSDLRNEIELLKQKVDTLGTRLAPIRGVTAIPEPDSDKVPEANLPPIGEEIRASMKQVRLVNSVIDDILGSIEI